MYIYICMCVCVCVCMFMYKYIYICVCEKSMCMYSFMCVYLFVSSFISSCFSWNLFIDWPIYELLTFFTGNIAYTLIYKTHIWNKLYIYIKYQVFDITKWILTSLQKILYTIYSLSNTTYCKLKIRLDIQVYIQENPQYQYVKYYIYIYLSIKIHKVTNLYIIYYFSLLYFSFGEIWCYKLFYTYVTLNIKKLALDIEIQLLNVWKWKNALNLI